MARRILTAEAGFRLPALKVDERIDIQWKQIIDDGGDWSDGITLIDPTWDITRIGEKYSYASTYGTIVDEDDRRWILGALERRDGTDTPPYVARVNEVQLDDQKEPGVIKIEILTGPDAEAFLRAEKTGEQVDFVKKNWLLILIVLLVGYWWFF